MPRRRTSGVSPWISAASKAVSAGCTGALRSSSDTVMWGRASISCRVKSACEPCIRAAITMEKPTPVATPATATSVWRTRKLDMRQGDLEGEVHGAPGLRARRTRTRCALAQGSSGAGAATRSPSATPDRISTVARAADAHLHRAQPHAAAAVDHDDCARPAPRRPGTSSAFGLLARDHVGLHAHADPQRRVLRQRERGCDRSLRPHCPSASSRTRCLQAGVPGMHLWRSSTVWHPSAPR